MSLLFPFPDPALIMDDLDGPELTAGTPDAHDGVGGEGEDDDDVEIVGGNGVDLIAKKKKWGRPDGDDLSISPSTDVDTEEVIFDYPPACVNGLQVSPHDLLHHKAYVWR